MGTEYGEYPPLDMSGLRNGYKMCVGNARRLIDDARTLGDAGRFRTAYLVLVLAMEELGDAVQLYEAGRSGVQDWEEWWGCYFSHPKAHGSASIEIPGMEKVGERLTRIDDDLVYVDFDKNNKRFMSPRDLPDRDTNLALSLLTVDPLLQILLA